MFQKTGLYRWHLYDFSVGYDNVDVADVLEVVVITVIWRTHYRKQGKFKKSLPTMRLFFSLFFPCFKKDTR